METITGEPDGVLSLGTLLGRRQAFSTIAARCSAADVAALREIRNQKAYLPVAKTFAEFCSRHTGISHTHANRMIRYLDEFGPEYFLLAQLAGLSPAQYRAIAPEVKEQALHHNGQTIALLPENAKKLVKIVAELRAAAKAKPAASASEQLARIERHATRLVKEIRAALRNEEQLRLSSILTATRQSLDRLDMELGRVV